MSVADIIYYIEISTILMLSLRDISKTELPKLNNWYYNNMGSKSTILQDLDKKFLETMAKN